MTQQYQLQFNLNGSPVSTEALASETLLNLLRNRLNIMSPKIGCESGDCGACTVLLDGEPIRSCTTIALTVQGREITTVEGLSRDGMLHPLQQAFLDRAASQCGFCTPGMILTLYALLNRNPEPSDHEIRESISGNLCRCTGYAKIIDAAKQASRELLKQRGR